MNTHDLLNDFTEERECDYKGEKYSVRDNGAVMRHAREGKATRKYDEMWTFGKPNDKGYACIANVQVHRIVATAFHGAAPSPQHVVDHIDTNRQNNRPTNLRWLTKLENILLNDFTRKKIIYLCGSVESFLENPSQLKGNESLDPNFSWMRAVTQAEAANTLENFSKLLISKQNAIRAIHQNTPKQKIDERIFLGSHNDNAISCNVHNEEGNLFLQEDIKTPQTKNEPITKQGSYLQNIISNVSGENGWNVERDVKGQGWKAKYLITIGSVKMAVNIGGQRHNVQNALHNMKDAGIKGCWLYESNRNIDIEKQLPQFYVEDGEVCLDSNVKLSIGRFLELYAKDKIEWKRDSKIKYINVYPFHPECYSCGHQISAYFIHSMITSSGDYVQDAESDIDIFSPDIKDIIIRYFEAHPELEYKFSIKTRYSRTMNEEYLSFGCDKCDAIFGNHYYNEYKMDLIYDDNPESIHRIDIESLNKVFFYPHWEIKS